MNFLTHATASEIPIRNGALPRDVQWMPPGRQTVQPIGFDEPFEMNVTPALAQQADAQLQELRRAAAAGSDVEPYLDFNHKDEGRAFKPTRMFWGGDDLKTGGIRLEGTWTGAGAKSVLDGELCCVSASWLLNKATKLFLGIRQNLGGLVPRSAFHAIQAFAKAADFISETKLPEAQLLRLGQKYGVDLTLRAGEKYDPIGMLAARLAEKHQLSESKMFTALQEAEPELWSFHLQSFGQVEHAEDSKAGAEKTLALAKEHQRAGMDFSAAWAKARNQVFGGNQNDSPEKIIAEETLALAKEHQRSGMDFSTAWAKAWTDIVGSRNDPPEKVRADAIYSRARELVSAGCGWDAAYITAKQENCR